MMIALQQVQLADSVERGMQQDPGDLVAEAHPAWWKGASRADCTPEIAAIRAQFREQLAELRKEG